jgi:hypothetical protein
MAAVWATGAILFAHAFEKFVGHLLGCQRGIERLRLHERMQVIEGNTEETPGLE